MRAIDADELKKCVLKWLPQDLCGKEEKEMPFETDICVSMLMEIDEQPTIQPKRGTWIDRGDRGDWEWQADGRGEHWHEWECNICHHYFDKRTFFCPHCGADMRGEQYG